MEESDKSYHYYPEGSYYPEIRISGKYLIEYGFDSGVRIEVNLSWREISIRPIFEVPSD